MSEKPAITSSELGTLWITFQQKTMVVRMLDYFIEKSDDEEALQIMRQLHVSMTGYIEKIKGIFQAEGAVVPVGFTSKDVNPEAPKLYDNGSDIMFLRLMVEISSGMHTLSLGMSYREDIVSLFRELTDVAQGCYDACTKYLLRKGLLARPPYVTMPESVEFVQGKAYLGGLNPFSDKRALNTVEVAHLYHAIESNIIGMQLLTGFCQSSQIPEVKKFFVQGVELAKNIVTELNKVLLRDTILTPSRAGGNTTRSTEAPFSDKLMMYCTSLFCSFSMGSGAIGTAFSLRNDLTAKVGVMMKDIFEYAHAGAKIMINNGWMEEPPQMEERKELMTR